MRIFRYATVLATASTAIGAAISLESKKSTAKSTAPGANAATAKAVADAVTEATKPRDQHASTKYFHEPGSDDILGHYDTRYFKEVVSYEERTDTLHHMMRAYLEYFREAGLETWIAHGTLLGWWWNGKLLPWDWDIDTQVSGETLQYMAKNLNRTVHRYVSEDKEVEREYLLDVNPFAWERERGDGMNIIDARWIDTRNGLYIDITGLSETKPDEQPGIWSCKNYHHYQTKDLYPMRESVYEGVPALIPYAYEKILVEEYKEKALVVTNYEGHAWDQQQKLWVKKPGYEKLEQQKAEEREKHKQKGS
ncbi:hypothetical protein EJ06DRAFT_162688 [Trichodelitschia bisporula]|uniref:LicD/FKTN/FKRP nucleotidyltransferase domain-containing protein n=1 Tax=Trichodelitschia bisporula TaxID=703511 RepID=A0A6G1HN10_9PEZI|nr:hypothetical protein EJ06DRAFT_162688 [Trichodelitschia bisporula]